MQKKTYQSLILVVTIISIVAWFSIHDAYAISVTWIPGNDTAQRGYAIWSGGPLPQNPPLVPTQFEVTDGNFSNNGIIDKINVLVSSTTYPTGINLTLTESGDTGHFYNSNLVFSNSTSGIVDIGSTQTVGISGYGLNTNSSLIEHIISNSSAPNGIWVVSSTDFNGIFLNLTETGPNTGIFTASLKFTTGPSIDGSAIHANPGDIISIVDLATVNGWVFNYDDTTEEIVGPNPDPAQGALYAKFNDGIIVSYKDAILIGNITNTADPGGGGGGLVRPGLVLDILAALGGSAHTVSPPSFGGSYYHFSDGLTLNQGENGTKEIFDISKYNSEIPKQVMTSGEIEHMTFKTFESYNPSAVIGMTLYFIPRGQDLNIDVSKSIADIEWEKGKPVEFNDPNHILSDVQASSDTDGKFQYTKFVFVPTKSYDKMSFIVRAWNDHLYTTEARLHDAIDTPAPVKTLPPGVIRYDNFGDLYSALERDGFYKPTVMSHIHDSSSVFGSSDPGELFWLYDTTNKTVTLVILDKDGNTIGNTRSSLDKIIAEKKGDYGFMHFTVKQLNRSDEKDMQRMMGIEASKAMFSALEKGIMPHRNWSSEN